MARRKKSKAKKRTKITKPQPIIIINEQPKNLRYWQQMLMEGVQNSVSVNLTRF